MGFGFQAPFPKPGVTTVSTLSDIDQRSYHRIFEAFYRGTFDAGVPVRLIHDVQIIGPDGSRLLEPAELATELPVLEGSTRSLRPAISATSSAGLWTRSAKRLPMSNPASSSSADSRLLTTPAPTAVPGCMPTANKAPGTTAVNPN
jgi:hypothetical protein